MKVRKVVKGSKKSEKPKVKKKVKKKSTESTTSTFINEIKHDPQTIPTSIIMSGVESDRYWDIVVNKCDFKTVLMSYHYLKGKPKDFLRKRLEKTPDVKVFVDSGAYTFLTNPDKFYDMPESFWKEYLEGYTSWVRDNADLIFACADLDIDDIVGSPTVDKWRADYFEPLKDIGVDVCYIWHTVRGKDGWKAMCSKYDYIGLSAENDNATLQSLTKMVNEAKKHNTRVHGMAITKTELLVRVPLFSADSTTWLVGQQYGELNWFDGRGMKRLDKKTWRTTYKTRLVKEPFSADWDLLINGMGGRGDTYELLRLNVIAYKLAEEHIRKRLRTKMYWLKENGSVEIEAKHNIEDINIPSEDWFEGDCSDYKMYLAEVNADLEMSKEDAVELLYSFFMYLGEGQYMIEDVETENLIEYCKQAINTEVINREDAIDTIKQFYKENATGVRNDFKEFNDGNRPKERSNYLDDSEYTFIDVSKAEIDMSLPPPKEGNEMPEVEAYDEELRKMDIVPIRDEKGRFLKGQKKVLKPKQIYSKSLPKLNCDTCYKAGDCPEYRAGYVCAFHKVFKQFDTRDANDVSDAMYSMVNINLERLQRALMFETMDGGMITPEVSALIDQNTRLLNAVKELGESRTVMSQRRVVRGDGSEEVTTSVNVNPNQGGILSQIFSMNTEDKKTEKEEKESKEEKSNIVDTDYKVE